MDDTWLSRKVVRRFNALRERQTSLLAGPTCPGSRFYVQVDWICKHRPTSKDSSSFGIAAVQVNPLAR